MPSPFAISGFAEDSLVSAIEIKTAFYFVLPSTLAIFGFAEDSLVSAIEIKTAFYFVLPSTLAIFAELCYERYCV